MPVRGQVAVRLTLSELNALLAWLDGSEALRLAHQSVGLIGRDPSFVEARLAFVRQIRRASTRKRGQHDIHMSILFRRELVEWIAQAARFRSPDTLAEALNERLAGVYLPWDRGGIDETTRWALLGFRLALGRHAGRPMARREHLERAVAGNVAVDERHRKRLKSRLIRERAAEQSRLFGGLQSD